MQDRRNIVFREPTNIMAEKYKTIDKDEDHSAVNKMMWTNVIPNIHRG